MLLALVAAKTMAARPLVIVMIHDRDAAQADV
jgi:hypothetical protein